MSLSTGRETSADSVDSFRERTTYLGRDYQAWSLRHQINLCPVDDDEESRLRSQHLLVQNIFHNRRNALVPDVVENPIHVLECGFGTGEWAYEIAETFPACKVGNAMEHFDKINMVQVLAVDISPIMELGDMPENLEQEIVDLNDPFTFTTSSFDLVHSQFVAQGLGQNRWPSYLTDIKRVLKNQGWVQLTEWELIFRSENGQGDKLQGLREWSEAYLTAVAKGSGSGRKSRIIPGGLETMLRVSGFQNVSIDVQEIPTCAWPASESGKAIGMQNLQNMESLLSAVALYPVTSRSDIKQADFTAMVDKAKEELRDKSAKPYVRLYTCYGQKA